MPSQGNPQSTTDFSVTWCIIQPTSGGGQRGKCCDCAKNAKGISPQRELPRDPGAKLGVSSLEA